MKLFRLHAPAALLVLALAACGGGGDTAEAAPPVAQPPTATGPDAHTGDCNLPDFVADTLARVNAFRAQPRTCGATTHPAAPALTWSGPLAQAADAHSKDMAGQNYFSHTSPQGDTLAQRIEATGYRWSAIGENIAAGVTTVGAAMAGWQASAGHCANLMNPNFTQVGMSCKGGTGTTYATYWTMDLARPR